MNAWYGKPSQPPQLPQQRLESPESPENDNYSGISVDTKPIVSKKWTKDSPQSAMMHFKPVLPPTSAMATAAAAVAATNVAITNKHHSPPSINEYIDEDQVEEISSDSTTNTGSNASSDNKLTSIFKWQKTKQLISNETISMDVDDEKVEGILV